MSTYNRRKFIKSVTAAGFGAGLLANAPATASTRSSKKGIPVGIIGLDTSHAPAFTRILHRLGEESDEAGYRVVAAYPYGSRTIESSYSRIPQFIEAVEAMGVEIVDSIEEVLNRVEYVMLLTNDGNPRLEQAQKVLEAGKTMFIDKPVAASFKDTLTIMQASKELGVPVFTSSGLRYLETVQSVRHENSIGKVLGADAFSPAIREETHPDFFWYGIHGVETLYTVLGTGCREVTRTETAHTDIVIGAWPDDIIGTFRGIREGRRGYGGTAYGSEEILTIGPFTGYDPLVAHIAEFFRTGISPVSMEESLEIYAFMEASDESKRRGGETVSLEEIFAMHR
jgi:hypothetical protein